MNHLQSIPMDPKLSLIKGLHCMKNNDKTHVGILKNEFAFWNVNGIMNTSDLLQSK